MGIRPRDLLRGAALCAFAFAVMLALAYGSSWARHLDATSYWGFVDLQRPHVSTLTEWFGYSGNAAPVATFAVLLAALAALRGRPRMSLFVLAYVGATSVSSQLLKALLAYPRDNNTAISVDPAAFPSGHATASMTIAIALVAVVPARVRPLAAVVGLFYAIGVSFSVVSMGWHFPSDVIGGFLLATGWALVLLAAVRAADLRFPARAMRSAVWRRVGAATDAVAGAGLVAAVVGGAVFTALLFATVLAFRLDDVVTYLGDRPGFTLVAGLLAVSAVGLLGTLTRVLARR